MRKQSTTPCSVSGCPNMVKTSNLCNAHYQKWLTYRDPLFVAFKHAPLEQRFWAQVDIRGLDECWPWLGHILKNSGYGQIRTGEKPQKWITTHRLAYILTHGPMVDGALACHTCEDRYLPGDISYRRCCNPAHIYNGTHRTNAADIKRTGRGLTGRVRPKLSRPGELNHEAKLTAPEVLRIRRRYAAGGETYFTLAAEYGVTFGSIGAIVTRKTWRHL